MMLDATAGNRMFWANKTPPNTVFMDKETRLARPPDIIGDFCRCPFRDNIFETVIFDPPHNFKRGLGSLFNENPKRISNHGFTWYGAFKNKIHCLTSINKAQKEFSRIAKRLCFKWNEADLGLWNLLPLFNQWVLVNIKSNPSKRPQGSKTLTHWVTFIRPDSSRRRMK